MSDAYARFLDRVREIHDFTAVNSLLAWDQEVNLPPKGVPSRARQLAAMAGLIHDRTCDAALGELMASSASQDLNVTARANLREFQRVRDRALKIPRSLVAALAEATSHAQQAWVQAKQQSEWRHFAPHLTRLVELKRQEAEAVGYTREPYDALLDEYEPTMRLADLEPLFSELKHGLVELIGRTAGADSKPQRSLLRQRYDVELQNRFGMEVLRDMGYDFAAGRLDRSAHPFTQGIAIADVRITTKYDPDDLGVGLFANLHEGGHALYEQGLPPEQEGTPVAQAVSLGIHESQSRLWENAVGRSRPFWEHYLPRLRELFPTQLGKASAEDLYRAVNVVRPSLIRIEADEVTYNLHIILRLELERALLRGEIKVNDLPALWAEKMHAYFGLEVPDVTRGPLQDIHWAFGVFGYFPTYTLGNLYAAQIFAQASAELDDLSAQLERGEFQPLLTWLREHVHQKGSLLPADELCRSLTGAKLQVKPFLDYLQAKFGDIYGL